MTDISAAPAQTHTVTVTGYASGGEGVAQLEDGRVVFIRGAARGDVAEVALTEVNARSARADIVRIEAPSPRRICPDCPVYPDCGGCDFRHITYEEELEAKLLRVNDALERIGGLSVRVDEILRTGQTDGYRNKAVVHSDGASMGFFRAGSHEIVPVARCLLLKDDLNDALSGLSAGGGDVTLFSGRGGMGQPPEEELDGLVFQVSGFFQVNKGAALLLFRKAREFAALRKNETLIDLYCGVGTITLFAGRDAGRALGVEQNPRAIKAARENARRNGFSHIEFLRADAADWNSGVLHPDCVIVDPPRKGLSPKALRKILDLSPKRIVYVSCDPATLARDLRLLAGYTVKDIRAVDMFPRTANVECCCLLVRERRSQSCR